LLHALDTYRHPLATDTRVLTRNWHALRLLASLRQCRRRTRHPRPACCHTQRPASDSRIESHRAYSPSFASRRLLAARAASSGA
jgi:hypothetical protein